MERAQIGTAPGFIPQAIPQNRLGVRETAPGLFEKQFGFGSQISIPSRRISPIKGDRSPHAPARNGIA